MKNTALIFMILFLMGFSLPPDNEIFIALEKIPFFEKQMKTS